MLKKSIDARRELIIPGNEQETLRYAVDHLIDLSKQAIVNHGAFYIALSGGSTPKSIFQAISQKPHSDQIDWDKWHLFWSDERSVPPTHPDSNYHMAMEAGFKHVPIPATHIHRMQAENDIEHNAQLYERTLKEVLQGRGFDLMMLGMGDDGHTASLFPHTQALHAGKHLVVANFVPQHNTWRMTMTYTCINHSLNTVIYVLGAKKQKVLSQVLASDVNFEDLPSYLVGTPDHKALWIADTAAYPSYNSR